MKNYNNNKKPIVVLLAAITALAALLAFIPSLNIVGKEAAAQQQQHQMSPSDVAHDHSLMQANNDDKSNQSSSGSSSISFYNGTMMMGGQQFYNKSGISLVNGVKITGISMVGDDHIAVNLSYAGQNKTLSPPGVTVVAMYASLNKTMILNKMRELGTMMAPQNSTNRVEGLQAEEMMMGMMMTQSNNQSGHSIVEQMLQQQHQQLMQNFASSNTPILSIRSGSNYIDAGWPSGVQSSSSSPVATATTTILVQLDGKVESGGHLMVIVVPFLHH